MRPLVLLLAVGTTLTPSADALQLRVYSSTSHDRFTGFSSNPQPNPSFIFADHDLTGVGWDATNPQRQLTLVSPLHFVGANHFRPAVGAELRFIAADGGLATSTVASLHPIENGDGQATDLVLGRLSAPIDPASGVGHLPCRLLDNEASYLGESIGVLGRSARGGRGTIAAISDFGGDPVTGGSGINTTRVFEFNYNSLAGLNDDAYAESGDSGSPSFVSVGGVPAIVGIHTAVLRVSGTTTTIDTFVPAYADDLNAIMEADGYHLTAAVPKSTTLDIEVTPPSGVIRAGYPATVRIDVSNNSPTVAANNLRLDAGLEEFESGSGSPSTGWITDFSGETVRARRGGLGPDGTTRLDITFSPTEPGPRSLSFSLRSDESSPIEVNAGLDVIGSFRSWATGLADPSIDGDDDGDSFPNLVEYAQGGDPGSGSTDVDGTDVPLGLRVIAVETAEEGTRKIVRFVRRTDASERAIGYFIESSPDADPESWTDVTSSSEEREIVPLKPGLEAVVAALPPGHHSHSFARLRISLDE